MTTGSRKSERSTRQKLSSPGRPPVWQRENLCQFLIVHSPFTGWPVEPSMEAGTRYLKSIAHPTDRPDMPVLHDEGELHVDSLAKNAAAFLRNTHFHFDRSGLQNKAERFCPPL